MQEEEKVYTPIRIKEERESYAKSYLLPSIGFALFAAGFYWMANSLEHDNGPRRVNALAYALYEALGKVNGTILLVSFCLLLLVIYIYKMMILQRKINNKVS